MASAAMAGVLHGRLYPIGSDDRVTIVTERANSAEEKKISRKDRGVVGRGLSRAKLRERPSARSSGGLSLFGIAAVLTHVACEFLLKTRIVLNHLNDLVILLRIQTRVFDRCYFL